MSVIRSAHRIAFLGTCLLGLALPLAGLAQGGVSSGEDPFGVGATDGRRLGLSQGRVEGRAQALFASFRAGFEQGLAEANEQGASGALAARFRNEGRTKGEALGKESGLTAGATAALDGWLARAPERPAVEAPAAPADEAVALCTDAQPRQLPLVREVTVEINPDGLETGESPIEVDAFDLDYPSQDNLRSRARAAGAVSEAVDFWVRDYKFAFQSAWLESFNDERSGTPVGDRKELEVVGLTMGREEGERRLACDSGQAHWRDGLESGWASGWRAGFDEAWTATNERHEKRAVVVLRDARLSDASGDGVFEPGEGLILTAELVNAGAVEARRSAGTWSGLRGIESEGHFDGGLAAGASRPLRVELGKVDPQAPPETSVVVRVRGLGSEAEVLNERLGRPAHIAALEGRLATDGGRIVVHVEAQVRSLSPESSRAELVLAGNGVTKKAGRLKGDETKRLSLVLPAKLPERVGPPVTGLLILRTEDGQPWHARRWSAPNGVIEAAVLAASSDAPSGAAGRLVEHLATEWNAVSSSGRSAELPLALRTYAAGITGLPRKAKERLDRLVTAPLLERIDKAGSPKRLRKRARELLAS